VLFYAEMAANEGHFTIADVLDSLNRKLVRRHPHVFGDEAARAAGNRAEVDAMLKARPMPSCATGRRLKPRKKAGSEGAREQGSKKAKELSRLDSVQRAMPALAEAAKLGSKRAEIRIRLADLARTASKSPKRTAELEAEAASADPARKPAVEAELGDLLFTVVNLGRHLGVDAEMALRNCNLRFRQRFREMELASPRPLEELSPNELEALWTQAKRKLAADAAASKPQEQAKP